MTHDEILKLAEQTGFKCSQDEWGFYTEDVIKFARLVTAAERAKYQELLHEVALWMHAAYDRPPQTPAAIAILGKIDAMLKDLDIRARKDEE